MPRITLTDFVDVVSKVGMQKITKLTAIKYRQPYSPLTDYWKLLRDHIVENHVVGGDKNTLRSSNQLTQNQNKQKNYTEALAAYRTFWGRKSITWFQPPNIHWNINGLDVSINPELGLVINNEWKVIKLYFKADPLSKAKVELILFLMHQVLPTKINNHDLSYCILDVRRSKLITPTGFNAKTIAALQGEAQYIVSVWPSL